MIEGYELSNTSRRSRRVKQFLGKVAVVLVTALNPNVAHADDLGSYSSAAPASPSLASPIPSETALRRPTASASPSIEAIATASPSPTASLIPSETAQPTPSASAEATATPTPQPSKIVVGVDDSGLYPTGPKPTNLVPSVPLEPGSAHPTHAQTHHIYGPQHFEKLNELPNTGLPTDVITGLGVAGLAGGGIVLMGLKRPK